jgi:hypothetical protein
MNKAQDGMGFVIGLVAGVIDETLSGRLCPPPLFRAKTMQAKQEA